MSCLIVNFLKAHPNTGCADEIVASTQNSTQAQQTRSYIIESAVQQVLFN